MKKNSGFTWACPRCGGELVEVLRLGLEPRARIRGAIQLAEAGHHPEAATVYEDLLATQPELEPTLRAVVLTNLGACHSAQGRAERGAALHRAAIELCPEALGPRWNLFANLYARGQRTAARRELEQLRARAGPSPELDALLEALRPPGLKN